MKTFFLLLLLAVSITFVVLWVDYQDRSTIQEWTTNHQTSAVKIERRLFKLGPYYLVGKNQRVWRVELSNGRVAWFRIGGFWGPQVEFE